MSIAARFGATILILPVTIAPSEAGPCKLRSIAFRRGSMPSSPRGAGQGPWRPESLDALRGYQPTPRSIAAAEGGGNGPRVQRALNALDGARAADASGNLARCNAELNRATRALRSH